MKNQLGLPVHLVIATLLTACSAPQAPDPVDIEAQAAVHLQTIPAANAAKYGNTRDMKNWRNPYLIVRTDGVALLDPANNEQRLLKTNEVLIALAQLPSTAWPYGRVVAISESRPGASPEYAAVLRKNRGIVAGTLEQAHVLVNWAPPS